MAREGGNHFPFCGLGSTLLTSKRISGFCLLCIICFLCLQQFHFHPLTRTTSRRGGASSSRAGIVLAAAAGSGDKAKDSRSRTARGQKVATESSPSQREVPEDTSTTTRTAAAGSSGAATAEKRSPRTSKWTVAGWTTVESPGTFSSPRGGASEGAAQTAESSSSSSGDRPRETGLSGDGRQPPDTHEEAGTRGPEGLSKSVQFEIKRKAEEKGPKGPHGRPGRWLSHLLLRRLPVKGEQSGSVASKETSRATQSGEDDAGGSEQGASGTTETQQQKEETPGTSGVQGPKKRGRSRRSRVRVRLGDTSSSEEEEQDSGSEQRYGFSDDPLRALRPLTRGFSSLIDDVPVTTSDGKLPSPSDTVKRVHATMQAVREAQAIWANTTGRTARVRRVYRGRKPSEQSTAPGQSKYPLRRPQPRPLLKEWDLRSRTPPMVARPQELQQREERDVFPETQDPPGGADVFPMAEQPEPHAQQEEAVESQEVTLIPPKRGRKKKVSDVQDDDEPEVGKKRKRKRRIYVGEEEDDTEPLSHMSIPSVAVPTQSILTSTGDETGSADAQTEEEAKPSEEGAAFPLQQGLDGATHADMAPTEQPPSSEMEKQATPLVATAEGKQKKKKHLSQSTSEGEKAPKSAKKPRVSEDSRASEKEVFFTEKKAESKKAKSKKAQPTEESSTQSSETAEKSKKKGEKGKRQLKRGPEKKERKKRMKKVEKPSAGTTTGGSGEGPTSSDARFESSSEPQKKKRKSSSGGLQQKRRQSTMAKARDRSSVSAAESRSSSGGARRPSASQGRKKKQEKKRLPERKGSTSAQVQKSKKKPARAATHLGVRRSAQGRDWKKMIMQNPRTVQRLLRRAQAASDPERVQRVVELLERQHTRRASQSRVLGILQGRLSARQRQQQRLTRLVEAMVRRFGRRRPSAPAAAQVGPAEQQQKPSPPRQQQQVSDVSPRATQQASAQRADQLAAFGARPSGPAQPSDDEQPSTSRAWQPPAVGTAAASSAWMALEAAVQRARRSSPSGSMSSSMQPSPPQQQRPQIDAETGKLQHPRQAIHFDVETGESQQQQQQEIQADGEQGEQQQQEIQPDVDDGDQQLDPQLASLSFDMWEGEQEQQHYDGVGEGEQLDDFIPFGWGDQQQQQVQDDVGGGEQQQLDIQSNAEGGDEHAQAQEHRGLSPEEEADVTDILENMFDSDSVASPVLSDEFLRFLESPVDAPETEQSSSSTPSLDASAESLASLIASPRVSQPSAVSGKLSGTPYHDPGTSSDYSTAGASQPGPYGQPGPPDSSALPLQSSLPPASSTAGSSQPVPLQPQGGIAPQMYALPQTHPLDTEERALDLSLPRRAGARSEVRPQTAADHQEDASEQSISAQAQASSQSAPSVSQPTPGAPGTSVSAPRFVTLQRIPSQYPGVQQSQGTAGTSSSGTPAAPATTVSSPALQNLAALVQRLRAQAGSLPLSGVQSPVSTPPPSPQLPQTQSAPSSPRTPQNPPAVSRQLAYQLLLRKAVAQYRAAEQARQQAAQGTPATSTTESGQPQGDASAAAPAVAYTLPQPTLLVQQAPMAATSTTAAPVYVLPYTMTPTPGSAPIVYTTTAQPQSAAVTSQPGTSTGAPGYPYVAPQPGTSTATPAYLVSYVSSETGLPVAPPFVTSDPGSSVGAQAYYTHVTTGATSSMPQQPQQSSDAGSSEAQGPAPFPYGPAPYQFLQSSQADDEDSSDEEPSTSAGHAPARRLRGLQEEGEQKWESSDKVKRMQLEKEIVEAGVPVLRQLSADLRSPLATVETNPEEEAALNRVDAGLNERQMLLKSIACFRTVEKHFIARRVKYVSLVDREAPNLGMREDEVLRLLFHAAWVTCYSNVKKQQLQQLVDGRLNAEEELLLLRRTPETPVRFSRKQHSLTEEVIRRFAREYPADDAKVNGTLGIVYSVLIVTGLFLCLLMLHRFYRSRRCRAEKNGKQKSVDTTQNRHIELSHCVKHSGCTSAPRIETCVF